MTGFVHSLETFSTVDGPGVRFVVFFQGCPMRCVYCHNPDTWKARGGTAMTVDEILSRYRKNRAFYSEGGLTATGGEPMMQAEFLTALFERAKEEEIHTCLDTAGILFRDTARFKKLVSLTDLVLLDIKHIDCETHRRLTGVGNERVLEFARYLDAHGIPMWIRHVVVPGWTDDAQSLSALGRFLKTLSNVQAVDVLPYHTLGTSKYEALHLTYPLRGVKPLSKEETDRAKTILRRAMNE